MDTTMILFLMRLPGVALLQRNTAGRIDLPRAKEPASTTNVAVGGELEVLILFQVRIHSRFSLYGIEKSSLQRWWSS
jgi:hypothetical protein